MKRAAASPPARSTRAVSSPAAISLFAPTGDNNGTGNRTFHVGDNDNEVISIKLQALVGSNGLVSLVDTITASIDKAAIRV